jgi:hypothetical protein
LQLASLSKILVYYLKQEHLKQLYLQDIREVGRFDYPTSFLILIFGQVKELAEERGLLIKTSLLKTWPKCIAERASIIPINEDTV